MLRNLILITFLVFPLPILSEQTNKQIAEEIYTETLSPYCPGRALKDCPSKKASELKNDILNKLNSGKTKQDVMSILIKRYGNHISALPENKGFGRLAWLLPPAFLISGLVLLTLFLKKSKGENKTSVSKERTKEKTVSNDYDNENSDENDYAEKIDKLL